MPSVSVIGGGLAGCEAAWLLANCGLDVTLYEMKPQRRSPAHQSDLLGELVCSNSLKAMREESASGILKREMTTLNSLMMRCAQATKVAAGGALAVDREAFAARMTQAMDAHPRITLVHEEVSSLPAQDPVIIATGPLTDGALAQEIQALAGEPLSFFDAAAPIVTDESIDKHHAFLSGRYDQPDDYLNCPMTKEEYQSFYQALMEAERAPVHDFDVRHYEGCMPIEALAARGFQTPLFGPLSPKGIDDPKTGRWPFALLQLRRENADGTLWNLVGCQTNLRFGEQKRVFGHIPALANAEFVRYGVMHRNTYLPAHTLDEQLRLRVNHRIRVAGQITGVEGYVESAAMGMMAGLFTACELLGVEPPALDNRTAIGALLAYVSDYQGKDFQPMGINFALMAPYQGTLRAKKDRHQALSLLAKQQFLESLEAYHSKEGFSWIS